MGFATNDTPRIIKGRHAVVYSLPLLGGASET